MKKHMLQQKLQKIKPHNAEGYNKNIESFIDRSINLGVEVIDQFNFIVLRRNRIKETYEMMDEIVKKGKINFMVSVESF